jgi:hypothetical protein
VYQENEEQKETMNNEIGGCEITTKFLKISQLSFVLCAFFWIFSTVLFVWYEQYYVFVTKQQPTY